MAKFVPGSAAAPSDGWSEGGSREAGAHASAGRVVSLIAARSEVIEPGSLGMAGASSRRPAAALGQARRFRMSAVCPVYPQHQTFPDPVGTSQSANRVISLRWRASRRHPNNCCGVSPWRRATTDTTAPGPSASATIRALSSIVQRRRPTAPVMTSMRRTCRAGSSVGSSLGTSRSPSSQQDQQLLRSIKDP